MDGHDREEELAGENVRDGRKGVDHGGDQERARIGEEFGPSNRNSVDSELGLALRLLKDDTKG